MEIKKFNPVFILYFCFISSMLFSQDDQIRNDEKITPCPFSFLETPKDYTELTNSNCYLARRYAPVVVQHRGISAFDIFVKVNYDGDWNHLNNWENGLIPGLLQNSQPQAYYDVVWTDKLYIITYSFYYPRDYSLLNLPPTSHEGDLERVLVYVERETMKVRGYTTTHHGNTDNVNCIYYPNVSSNNFSQALSKLLIVDNHDLYYDGDHPIVYSSAGSHAIYTTENHALNEPAYPNDPTVVETTSISTYIPGNVSQPVSTNTSPIGFEENIFLSNSSNVNVYFNTYQLINVFAPNDLWDHRDTENLFDQFWGYQSQKFVCNTLCGNENGAAASAPWNGLLGMNPISHIQNNLMPFECECIDDWQGISFGQTFPECNTLIFNDEDFIFNEYLCEVYKILPYEYDFPNTMLLSIQGAGIELDENVEVEWTINANGYDYTCTGCTEKDSKITLEVIGATWNYDPITSNNLPFWVNVSAKFNLLECGDVVTSNQFVYVDPLIANTNNSVHIENEKNNIQNDNSFIGEPELGLNLYPNPTKDFIYVEISKNINNPKSYYKILDSYGKLISEGILKKDIPNQISLKGFSNGIYFIKVDSYTERFVVSNY